MSNSIHVTSEPHIHVQFLRSGFKDSTLCHVVQFVFFRMMEDVHLRPLNYEVLLQYPLCIPALLPYNSSLVFLALLTVEDNLRV